jgi:hypothetical protein
MNNKLAKISFLSEAKDVTEIKGELLDQKMSNCRHCNK